MDQDPKGSQLSCMCRSMLWSKLLQPRRIAFITGQALVLCDSSQRQSPQRTAWLPENGCNGHGHPWQSYKCFWALVLTQQCMQTECKLSPLILIFPTYLCYIMTNGACLQPIYWPLQCWFWFFLPTYATLWPIDIYTGEHGIYKINAEY